MKRLREMDEGDSVKAVVITGPGDLMTWEVSASTDSDGVALEIIGRGSDLEAAAASVIALLTAEGSTIGTPTDGASTMHENDATFPATHAETGHASSR